MEINITRFITTEEPYNYSSSRAERGINAGPETWRNAVALGGSEPLLTTPEELRALRDHVKGYGAWDDAEIAAWDDAECNALLIQLISGDMREAGMDAVDIADFDWDAHEEQVQDGQLAGNIFHGSDGEYYYYLGY